MPVCGQVVEVVRSTKCSRYAVAPPLLPPRLDAHMSMIGYHAVFVRRARAIFVYPLLLWHLRKLIPIVTGANVMSADCNSWTHVTSDTST